MSIVRLDGVLLSKMLQNGLRYLHRQETAVNKLNVFPVADGDTGTNMRLTLENGLKYAPAVADAGQYLCSLSNGMLLGARGNSGVILSQLFKGMYLELARNATVSAAELRNGLIRGYRTAYAAVAHPVEGTILTVAREGIESIRHQIGRSTTVDTMLPMYVAEMKKSLAYTPELLGVLKDAGVVDSGAMGYIFIIEGMMKYLYGEIVEDETPAEETAPVSLDGFDEHSTFEDGYCLEGLLQRMDAAAYDRQFDGMTFAAELERLGNSLVVVQDGMRVKLHVHTKTPESVIALCRRYGEFLTFKLENMQLQHNSLETVPTPTAEHKPLATVAVVDGRGMQSLFRDLGCDIILDGGATMNTSTQEFLDAFNALNADAIAVLPNNKNTVGAAEQAKSLYKGKAVIRVMPSRSVVEAYCALAMDVSDSDDIAFRLSEMENGIRDTHTLAIAAASKDYTANGISILAGSELALVDDEILFGSRDRVETVCRGMKLLPDVDAHENLLIFRGADATDADEAALVSALEAQFPDLEIHRLDGGQHTYRWLIGLL